MTNYYTVDIKYTASGYKSGIDSTGVHGFYVEADSFGDAFNQALEQFRIYEKAQTKKGGGYEGLKYTAEWFIIS